MSLCWSKCCAVLAAFPSRLSRDPHEVCELHRKNRYSLIRLDLQMPDRDGFQVMEGLKAIETDGCLPVLAITAQSDHKLRALKTGAKDFVSKPFDLAEVLMRVYHRLEVRLLLPKPFSIAELLETVRVVLCATDSARAQLEPLPDWRSQPSADGLRR